MGPFLVFFVIVLANPLMLFAMLLLLYLIPAILLWIVVRHIAHDVHHYFADPEKALQHT